MLSAEEIEFIEANRGLTGAEAMLRAGSGAHGFDLREAATQIDCRRKCAGKLPGFLKHNRFRFPDPLSAEQCTREDVARFHASLIEPGERVLDMTAGLGIDAMSLALGGARVTAVEIDAARAQALRENAALLGAQLQVLCADSRKVLEEPPEPVDTIFIDPARRDSAGRRTYGFADCTPDLLSLLPLIMSRCSRLLVKASPLLDVTQILRELPGVSRLRAVEAGGECKELLIEVRKGEQTPVMEAVSVGKYRLVLAEKAAVQAASPADVQPGAWLYEPSPAVMKLAPWGELAALFPTLKKFDKSTHLFVSAQPCPDFPGRCLRITALPGKKDVKGLEINVVSRNYPLTPAQIAGKYSLKSAPGAHRFLYAARLCGKPLLLLAEQP